MRQRERRTTKVGFAWYLPEQWSQLLELSADRDLLEDTWEEWERHALRTIGQLRRMGRDVVTVVVELDDLVAWCREQERPVDGAARAGYVADRVRRNE